MTGGSTEVSKKIRAAIKAKLEELGVYVDEELPDYIMVMIANKKEKAHMKEDLLLFLGKNAGRFVDWLFDIFERLQSAGNAPNSAQDSSEGSKRRDAESSVHRREAEKSNKREKEENTTEKKKRQESSDRQKNTVSKEHEKREKETDRGTKEAEKKESERHGKSSNTAKIVKSKPSYKTPKSPVLPLEKTHRRRKSGSSERRAFSRSGTKRDDSEKMERTSSHTKSRTERDSRIDAQESRKRNDMKERQPKKDVSVGKLSNAVDSGKDSTTTLQRKRKAAVASPSPPAPILDEDIDDEERIVEEESARILRSKKVQSSAVVKLPPEPAVRSVSSQIVVKRKMPEKETTTKQSRGVKSLFLKAIKEAGETTRTASQIAGYGGGGVVTKKEKEVSDRGKHKQGDANSVDDEESIEIDVYDDIGDALVVMPDETGTENGSARSIVQAADECNGSEPEVDRKRPRIHGPSSVDEPKFFITLKSDSISGLAKRLTKIGEGNVEIVSQKPKMRKRRNEANPILAHLNLSQPRQIRKDVSPEKIVVSNTENDRHLVASPDEASGDTKPVPAWDLQIQLPEEDTSDDGDDEAQIDAVLASACNVAGQGFDEVPPTPTLSNPAFRPQTPPPQLFYSTSRSNMFTINRQPSNTSTASSMGLEKIMERCKFWPNCSLQNCVYIHPNKLCSNFPNCSYGDRCIYIHPQCKFDRECWNPKCIYAHSLKSSTATASPTVSAAAVAQAPVSSVVSAVALPYNANIPCKYGGKCANASCSFKHPKLCRFGNRCKNRACYFWHPSASAVAVLSAAGGKYKWKAPSSTAS